MFGRAGHSLLVLIFFLVFVFPFASGGAGVAGFFLDRFDFVDVGLRALGEGVCIGGVELAVLGELSVLSCEGAQGAGEVVAGRKGQRAVAAGLEGGNVGRSGTRGGIIGVGLGVPGGLGLVGGGFYDGGGNGRDAPSQTFCGGFGGARA